MPDETPVEVLPEELPETDAPAQPIDLDLLLQAAIARRDEMRAAHAAGNRKDDGSTTYSQFVIDLLNNNPQAIQDALRAEAVSRGAALDKHSQSATYKKKALAYQVNNGQFDKVEPLPGPIA